MEMSTYPQQGYQQQPMQPQGFPQQPVNYQQPAVVQPPMARAPQGHGWLYRGINQTGFLGFIDMLALFWMRISWFIWIFIIGIIVFFKVIFSSK